MNAPIIALSCLLGTINPKFAGSNHVAQKPTEKPALTTPASSTDAAGKTDVKKAEQRTTATAATSKNEKGSQRPANTVGPQSTTTPVAQESKLKITTPGAAAEEIQTRPVRVKPDVILGKKKLKELRMLPANAGNSRGMMVRVTVYWKNGCGTDYYSSLGVSSTGRPLVNKKSAAVDPNIIPYGSKILLPQAGKELVAVDTGSAVVNRTASKKLGKDVPVVDIFFDNKKEALNFAANNPLFMQAIIQN